jgi:hypothetical protein
MRQPFLFVSFLLLPFLVFAQDTSSSALKTSLNRKVFFTSNDPVEITLVSDFRTIKNKKQKKVFQPATATVTFPNLPPVTEPMQLAARGEFRRTTCLMPSLMLDFKNEKAPVLSALKKLKLVCGCSTSKYDEELLLKEYLVYKIYNVLTDMSFGVRLTKMTYRDAQNKMKEYTQYGFLIEDLDDVAKRNSCREYKKQVLYAARTDRSQTTLVSMFQYMIGNTDWSLSNNHNIRYIQFRTDTASYPFIVPYDFDYCGLVNAPYAIPQQEFGIEKVTDRYYRGVPREKEEIDQAVKMFKDKRELIAATVMNFELLDKKVRQQMLRFIDDFYSDLDDKRKLKYVFQEAVDHN